MKTPILRNARWRAILLGAVMLVAIAAGLRWKNSSVVQSQPPIGDIATIFVAPFAVSGDGAEPWAGAGLAEEIRIALASDTTVVIRRARVERVRPPARSNDGGENINRILAEGRRVEADYVLTGTLGRKSGTSEIGLRLVRVADEKIAWSGTFWRSSADLPTFAVDLAAAVTEAIGTERERQARGRTRDFR